MEPPIVTAFPRNDSTGRLAVGVQLESPPSASGVATSASLTYVPPVLPPKTIITGAIDAVALSFVLATSMTFSPSFAVDFASREPPSMLALDVKPSNDTSALHPANAAVNVIAAMRFAIIERG